MTEKLDKKIAAFLSKPEEETIHDIRTTIRRIQAIVELLPKSIRKKKKVSTYLTHARTLFKVMTPLRDVDVIQTKLKKYEQYPEVKEILEAKKKTREGLLKAAYKATNSLRNDEVPRFKASQISQSKLSKRKKKLLRKYQSLLVRQMKVLIANPSIEQLHEFRKNCKMLRYTLEFDSKSKDTLMSQLVKIQGNLGVVLDVQATISALSDLPGGDASIIKAELNAEKERANTEYLAVKPKFEISLANLSSRKS